MTTHTFQLAQTSEIPEILGIYTSLIGFPGLAWNTEYPSQETAEGDIAHNSLYTLKDGEKIIAVVTAAPLDELADFDWGLKNPCEIGRLGVLATELRKGIGQEILGYTIAEIKSRNFDGIIMLVSKDNLAALALYQKNGFQICGEFFEWGIDFYRLFLRF
ncbi:MAG: GNAT family N-acetyltransferase [Turicibacter sp.]|nr:GNAT family N-acetyltransferase [Turicibacter sp.]